MADKAAAEKSSFLKAELAKFREQQRTAQDRVKKTPKPKAKPKPKVKADAALAVGVVGPESKVHWTDLAAQAASGGQRHVPQAAGLKIKKLLDCLWEEERGMTIEELQEKTGVNLTRDTALAVSLMKNQKVRCEGALLHYHAQHQVKSEAQLLALLDKNPEGIYMVDLKDAYKQCVAHLRALTATQPRRVIILTNLDNQQEVVYSCDPRLALPTDQDVANLWAQVPVPENEDDLRDELQKVGLKASSKQSAPSVKRTTRAEQKHKEKIRKLRSVQNAHVAELFDLPPDQAAKVAATTAKRRKLKAPS